MKVFQGVAGRQMFIPIADTTVSASTGTFTVNADPGTTVTVSVDGVDVSASAGSIAALADAIADGITAESSITTVSASSDGVSVVTLTAVTPGSDGDDIEIESDNSDVAASGSTLEGGGTGVSLTDLTLTAFSGSSLLSDPATTLQMSLTEIDSSSAAGVYELKVIPDQAGLIYLKAEVEDFSDEYAIQVELEGADLIGSKRAGAEGDYVFTVEDSSDAAVEGATVRVYDSEGTTLVIRGTTNSDGQITFALPTGDYQVRTNLRGYDFSDINPTEITVTANSENTPIIYELVPSEASEGDVIAIKGLYFDDDETEVTFAGSAVSADAVSTDGDTLTVTVPSVSDTAVTIKVRKPDPDDSTSYLTSNYLTLVVS